MHESVTQSPPTCTAPAAGFYLLENLTALAIVMLTVLGTARQFGEALRVMRDNTDTRNAVMLGEDVMDRIAAINTSLPPDTSFSCLVGEARCFESELIESEINEWHRLLERAMPAARVELSVSEAPATRTFLVAIEWQDRHRQERSQEFEIVLRK